MDFISNEKLLNSNEEEIKEYKKALIIKEHENIEDIIHG